MDTKNTVVGLVRTNAGCEQTIMLHDSNCQMVNRGRGQRGRCVIITESEARDLSADTGNKLVNCKCVKTVSK